MERVFYAGGMVCGGCCGVIERGLKDVPGVTAVRADYGESSVTVAIDGEWDDEKIRVVESAIGDMGYETSRGHKAAFVAVCAAVLGYFILRYFGLFDTMARFPVAQAGMGYGALFVVGLLTSVHCVGMCGSINLSVCLRTGSKPMAPSLLYNAGRVVSYTAVGAAVGALGSAVSFSGVGRGFVAAAAGGLMIVMGLNMLGLLPWFRTVSRRLPRVKGGPFAVGILNGFMPCGPLQAMQLYALSTASPAKGAAAMFVFALGTAPLMFGLGAAGGVIASMGGRMMRNITRTGAAVVVLMGLGMLGSGLALSGISLPCHGPTGATGANSAVQEGGVQTVVIDLEPGAYAPVTVKRGVPVRFVVRAKEADINGCNNEILIPAYDIAKKIVPGENVIEFTPQETGVVPYSCWMGMIRSSITVVE